MVTATSLSSLPLEIQCSVLCYLPVASLLVFARTNRQNYDLARNSLKTLHAAVFSKKVHGLLAFLNIADHLDYQSYLHLNEPGLDWINLPAKVTEKDTRAPSTSCCRKRSRRSRPTSSRTNSGSSNGSTSSDDAGSSVAPGYSSRGRHHQAPTPTSSQAVREVHIHRQNALLNRILSSPCLSSLTTLTIHTYALLSPALASTLATKLPHLQHLALNFSHPAIHDACLPSCYWNISPTLEKEGCTAWNLLGSIGSNASAWSSPNHRRSRSSVSKNGSLSSLKSLSLTRVAISSLQLRKWVERNPGLETLNVRLVPGVDRDFLEGIAKLSLDPLPMQSSTQNSTAEKEIEQPKKRKGIKTLVLDSCPNLTLSSRCDFAWVEALVVSGGLRELSFKGCRGVDLDELKAVYDERGWAGFGGEDGRGGLAIIELQARKEIRQDLETRSLSHIESADSMGADGEVMAGGSGWRDNIGKLEVDPLFG